MSCDIAFDAALSSKVAYECMFSRPPRIFSLLNVLLTRTPYILSRRISVVQSVVACVHDSPRRSRRKLERSLVRQPARVSLSSVCHGCGLYSDRDCSLLGSAFGHLSNFVSSRWSGSYERLDRACGLEVLSKGCQYLSRCSDLCRTCRNSVHYQQLGTLYTGWIRLAVLTPHGQSVRLRSRNQPGESSGFLGGH